MNENFYLNYAFLFIELPTFGGLTQDDNSTTQTT